eukprot:jgi/Ulvmu1/12213/UM086_0002.1
MMADAWKTCMSISAALLLASPTGSARGLTEAPAVSEARRRLADTGTGATAGGGRGFANSPAERPLGATGPVATGPTLAMRDASLTEVEAQIAVSPGPPLEYEFAEDGALRLVAEVAVNGFTTGALQVAEAGRFAAVCSAGLDDADAAVACRQLGFPGAAFVLRDPFALAGSGNTPSVLDLNEILAPFALASIGCTGTEERLVDCPPEATAAAPICEPFGDSYAFIACGNASAPAATVGSVRLARAETAEETGAMAGRLEVYAGGGWGTVCGAGAAADAPAAFSAAAAGVACRQLGFAAGFRIQSSPDVPPPLRRVPIVLGAAGCSGTEANLLGCSGAVLGAAEECGHTDDVFVLCHAGPDPETDGALRLMGGAEGPGYQYGRLEIFLRGFWSNICNADVFSPAAAQVACSVLGFQGGAALEFAQSYNGDAVSHVLPRGRPVALANVDCNGTEASLLECASEDEAIPGCGVSGTRASDNLILACGSTDPMCEVEPPAMSGEVRLSGGSGSPCDTLYTGFVEVYRADMDAWGAICTDGANPEDRLVADVVCRQLGFPHGTAVTPLGHIPDMQLLPEEAVYEEGFDPEQRFFMSDVACSGVEERVGECRMGGAAAAGTDSCMSKPSRLTVACRQFPIVEALESVVTPGAQEGDVRLVDEVARGEWRVGRLEVFFEGSWGQVCSGGFGGAEAAVACRQLGLGAGTTDMVAPEEDSRTFVFPEVALAFAECSGTEERLLDCAGVPGRSAMREPEAAPQCYGTGSPGLQLACVAEPVSDVEELTVRLVDTRQTSGGTAVLGTLEIFHSGAWGTLCDGSTADPAVPAAFDMVRSLRRTHRD